MPPLSVAFQAQPACEVQPMLSKMTRQLTRHWPSRRLQTPQVAHKDDLPGALNSSQRGLHRP